MDRIDNNGRTIQIMLYDTRAPKYKLCCGFEQILKEFAFEIIRFYVIKYILHALWMI